jgi:hypothetical protein
MADIKATIKTVKTQHAMHLNRIQNKIDADTEVLEALKDYAAVISFDIETRRN